MKIVYSFILFLFFSHFLFAQNDKNNISNEVEVIGLVEKPMKINMESVKKMKWVERKDFKITGLDGTVKRKIANFKGVLLKSILEEARIKLENPKDRGKYFVLITATDGYQVIFSYNELMYSVASDNTYLVFEEEGKEIDKEGKFVIICASDIISGPRHVKWLKTIEVKRVD